MKKIKIIKRVVDIVEAKNRTEAFNEFVKTLGRTWEIDRNYLTATRSDHKKLRRCEQYTFEEVNKEN